MPAPEISTVFICIEPIRLRFVRQRPPGLSRQRRFSGGGSIGLRPVVPKPKFESGEIRNGETGPNAEMHGGGVLEAERERREHPPKPADEHDPRLPFGEHEQGRDRRGRNGATAYPHVRTGGAVSERE